MWIFGVFPEFLFKIAIEERAKNSGENRPLWDTNHLTIICGTYLDRRKNQSKLD